MNMKTGKGNRMGRHNHHVRPSLPMYRIAASSPPVKPNSALPPGMTLSNGKGVCLPEAPALANVIKGE